VRKTANTEFKEARESYEAKIRAASDQPGSASKVGQDF